MVPWLLSEQDERKSRNFHYAHLGLCGAVCKLRHESPLSAFPRAPVLSSFWGLASKSQINPRTMNVLTFP